MPVIQESPLLEIENNFDRSLNAPSRPTLSSGQPINTFVLFEFRFIPQIVLSEMSDNEFLQLAESAFSFLDSPEEDIYNDLLKPKE